MKLTVLVITLSCMQVSAAVFSQNITLSVKKAPLENVLKQINKQTGFEVLYSTELIRAGKPVDLNVKNLPLNETLIMIFRGQVLGYEILEKTILIKEKATDAIRVQEARQQPGRISGKIVDDKGEPLPGANIKLIELNKAVTSSVDGTYQFGGVPSGTYIIEVSYISFQTKRIAEVIVKDGQLVRLDVVLKMSTSSLNEVVVRSSYKKESVAGLYAQQKNNASITDGISAEQISRTPDNNLGQVLKRISGVTTIDTRYVVVRGMTERYNQAMLDGVIIPSTDMNRRNFSFDVVPQELVSSVVVNKTASPDVSAEFSGGQIMINTLDIPEQNFNSFTMGTGYNTRTTGKDFVMLGGRGKYDYLGFDDGRRSTPANLQSWTQRDNAPLPAYAIPQSKNFNSEALKAYTYQGAPNQNYRFSLGRLYQMDKNLKIGFTSGLTYRNTQETNPFQTIRGSNLNSIGEGDPIDTATLRSEGNLHKFNTTIGGVLNAGIQGEKFKLASKNYYSHVLNETSQYASRFIQDGNQRFLEFFDSPEFTSVYQSKLEGENLISNKGLKFNWTGALTNISQEIKDMRRLRYNKTTTIGDVDYYESPNAVTSSEGTGLYDYRLSTRLNERDYNWTANLSQPFNFLNVLNYRYLIRGVNAA